MLVVAALGLTLAPWTIRNYRVTGHFVPTTLWAGPSLYDALSPQATGDSEMSFIERDGRYTREHGPDFEYAADQFYRQRALEFVRHNPLRTIVLALKKLGRFLNPFPNAGQFQHWTIILGVGLFELPVLGLALGAFWKERTNWRLCHLAAGPLVYFALVHSVFAGSVRYRLPAEYPLLVLTAIGLRWLLDEKARRFGWGLHHAGGAPRG